MASKSNQDLFNTKNRSWFYIIFALEDFTRPGLNQKSIINFWLYSNFLVEKLTWTKKDKMLLVLYKVNILLFKKALNILNFFGINKKIETNSP